MIRFGVVALAAAVSLIACGGDRSAVESGKEASGAEQNEVRKEFNIHRDPADGNPGRSVSLTIYRDQYGVPQVFSDSNYGVYFGYGHSVASDRLFQMEMLKRTNQGRVAEVLGDKYLDLDIKVRTQYNHPLVQSQVEALSQKDLDILEGYAAGMNARIDELMFEMEEQGGQLLPKPFYDYGFEPSRWTAFDVASIFVGSIAHRYADFNSERDNLQFLQAMEARHGKDKAWALFNTSKWLKDQTSPTTIARSGAVTIEPLDRPEYLDQLGSSEGVAHIVFDDEGRFAGLSDTPARREQFEAFIASRGYGAHAEFTPASNYWAMSDLSDAKGALLNGPQFAFGMPSYVYGIGLHGGDFDVVGSTLLALPSLLFAHNNDLAWGSTAGISDQTDEFWLELNPDNPEQYRYQGEWRDFDRREEIITVKGGEPVVVTARRAAQGMVQAFNPEQGIAWVRARAWEGKALDDLMAWVWLATDRSLEAAEQRIAGKSTNINMYTMDKNGRLGYVHSGKYPARAPGHDPRLPAIGDGSMDWQGLRDYADNPKMREPAQGWVVNWNNRPKADWISSDLWPYTWSRADRADILMDEIKALKQRADGGSVAQMVDINTRSTFEDVNHRYLLPVLNRAAKSAALSASVTEALALLNAWDKAWMADDSGDYGAPNTLMESFVRHLNERVFRDDVGDDMFHLFAATNYPNNPLGASLGTPVGVRIITKAMDDLAAGQQPAYDIFNGQGPEAVMLASFADAVAELSETQGDDMQAWRLAASPMQWLPVNFRGVPQASEGNTFQTVTYQNRGTENNVFVATGKGIEARDINPPGQGGHLMADGTPAANYDNQFELYNSFGYKPLPFSEEDIKASAASVIQLEIVVP